MTELRMSKMTKSEVEIVFRSMLAQLHCTAEYQYGYKSLKDRSKVTAIDDLSALVAVAVKALSCHVDPDKVVDFCSEIAYSGNESLHKLHDLEESSLDMSIPEFKGYNSYD